MNVADLGGPVALALAAGKILFDFLSSRNERLAATLEHSIADETLELEQLKSLGGIYGDVIERLREDVQSLRDQLVDVDKRADAAAAENRLLKQRVQELEQALIQAHIPLP